LKHASIDQFERSYDEWFPPYKKNHQPEYWTDNRFNHPSRPVVGITWFEATAYLAWLSSQTGQVYSLPTEGEWEAAARGQLGYIYAYGYEFDAAYCNTLESRVNRTTPVGVFPQGCTPEGIYDMSGNVWEWTSTIWGENVKKPGYVYPYKAQDGRENMEDGSSSRVVRGGSWYNSNDMARAGFRNYFFPHYRFTNAGFRIVVRRSLASS